MRRRFRACLAALLTLSAPSAVLADPAPLAVQILTVHPRPDVQSLSLTGEVVARDTLTASFPSSGRIAQMMVSSGDHVKAGAALAREESVQQEQALRAAEAALASAKATQVKARDDANRQDGLLEQGATTRSARDAAADALRAAEAGVAQAEADLDRAKKALSDTVLKAPAAAQVIAKMADVGQVVGAAQPVLKLAIGQRTDAIFQVPEVLLTRTSSTPVKVVLAPVDQPDNYVIGMPRLISPLVDPRQGTVKVTVAMPALPAGTRIGDAIVGTIRQVDPPRISLPWTAMAATESGPAVWVVDAKTRRVHLQQVKILRYETGRIVLESGLKDGQMVVGLGADRLYPGRAVRPADGF